MKRLIIATVLLIAATIAVTMLYFRHLDVSGKHANLAMRTIPNDASVIFEFSNDKDFYDIFSGNTLFENVIGQDKQDELIALRKVILQNPLLQKYFTGQEVFVSLHPQKNNTIDFLITTSVSQEFREDILEQVAKQSKNGMVVTAITIAGKPGYEVYLSNIKKRFYLINQDDLTLSGSFSKEVIEDCANYDYHKEKESFVLLPDQQRSTSLANLYVNYQALTPFVEQLFQNKNYDVFRSLRQFPANAALSLNFRSDALLFNGISQVQSGQSANYFNLFSEQKPVPVHLKELFPSTTAYFTSFAVSDPRKFESDLADLEAKSNFYDEKTKILAKVRKETGIRILKEFSHVLGNEFAIVATHYHEKIGIIQITDGVKLLAFLTNIGKMTSDNSGQLSYEKLPQILLGEPFSIFKRPYFRVIDNYLILANTESELGSYNDTYTNRKFLSKTDGYNDFNNLLSERCNVACFIQFKNAIQLFKQDMKSSFYKDLSKEDPGWKNFYGASWQFSAADRNFYTNFCLRLNTDTTSEKTSF
jgi:hypothetical protein